MILFIFVKASEIKVSKWEWESVSRLFWNIIVPLDQGDTGKKTTVSFTVVDIYPESKGDGGESVYGSTFEGKNPF